ncbi:hypothetical protein AVEN_243899-1, partial [Araneus ventricosus]
MPSFARTTPRPGLACGEEGFPSPYRGGISVGVGAEPLSLHNSGSR